MADGTRNTPGIETRHSPGCARELAAQTAHERRVSPEPFDTAGLCHLCVPESQGGQEAPSQVLVELVEAKSLD